MIRGEDLPISQLSCNVTNMTMCHNNALDRQRVVLLSDNHNLTSFLYECNGGVMVCMGEGVEGGYVD